jgi:hypothetical protein
VEQRSYEENFLAHPFGIPGQGGVTVFPETNEPEKLVHFWFEGAARQSAEAPDKLEMFVSAEMRIEMRLFGHVADAALKGFASFGIFVDVAAVKRDFAGCRLKEANDHLDRGALAGAVGTEIAERFAAMNHEADMVDNWDSGVMFRQVANFEHGNLDLLWKTEVPQYLKHGRVDLRNRITQKHSTAVFYIAMV